MGSAVPDFAILHLIEVRAVFLQSPFSSSNTDSNTFSNTNTNSYTSNTISGLQTEVR